MPRSPYNRHPLAPSLVLALGVTIGLLLALFVVDAIEYAYRRIGIGEGALFALVLGSLLGGLVNIPIARLRSDATVEVREIPVYGIRYRVPVVHPGFSTILAVNLGGAVIPAAVSVLLLVRDDVWWQAAVGVVFVAALVHAAARPVPGLGIAVPGLVPPLLAAGIALLVAPHTAAAVAYVSGTLGTLTGADLLNLHRLPELGAGVAAIGGAGTFDGVFLSGIIAVLLVGIS
jgi:uncharacterized membrane protein